ncbi:hypothetical protein KR009_007528 [Drosophila setifemur]|nr:hypothetical protein KR009_007528 [Drosophila setifemur]
MKTPKIKEIAKGELKPVKKELGVKEDGKVVKKTKQKSKKKAANQETISVKAPVQDCSKTNTLSAKDLAKIEKKKAKKLSQKLKKQEKKSAPKEVKQETQTEVEPEAKPFPATERKGAKGKASKKATANNKSEGAVKRQRAASDEAATIFVGNLPINTKRVQLVKLLQPYGEVQAIRLRTAGGKQLFKHKHRKGAGSLNAYVVLQHPEIAQKALALNGSQFKENHLRVTPAAKAGGGDENGQYQQPSDADAKRTVFVGSLKYSANEEKLREIFSSCGDIDYIRCLQDGDKGCKGVAYVCFQKADAVGLALELNQTLLDDRPINVERYAVKKLGAKHMRDAAAAAAGASTPGKSKNKKQNSAGAKKRLDKKKGNEHGKAAKEASIGGQKKKSEYRGVKVNGIKKVKKPKKKTNDGIQALAKKIAPKQKS